MVKQIKIQMKTHEGKKNKHLKVTKRKITCIRVMDNLERYTIEQHLHHVPPSHGSYAPQHWVRWCHADLHFFPELWAKNEKKKHTKGFNYFLLNWKLNKFNELIWFVLYIRFYWIKNKCSSTHTHYTYTQNVCIIVGNANEPIFIFKKTIRMKNFSSEEWSKCVETQIHSVLKSFHFFLFF